MRMICLSSRIDNILRRSDRERKSSLLRCKTLNSMNCAKNLEISKRFFKELDETSHRLSEIMNNEVRFMMWLLNENEKCERFKCAKRENSRCERKLLRRYCMLVLTFVCFVIVFLTFEALLNTTYRFVIFHYLRRIFVQYVMLYQFIRHVDVR